MASIVDETREKIDDLFSNHNFWITAVPKDAKVATLPPSSQDSLNFISVMDGCSDIPYLRAVRDQLLNSHFSQPVSDTFWTTLSSHVMHGISGPLFSYQSHTSKPCNEASVRSFLIEPVIRELASHLSYLLVAPPDLCTLFTASVSMEHTILLHDGTGRPASVDFCVLLHQEDGKVISRVPGEAKVVITTQHLKQISTYMWKIATSSEYQGRCVVGLLMDHQCYSIAFSPCMYTDGKSVPITYVSPRIMWRNVSLSPVAVVRSSLLFLSGILLANFPAQTVGSEFDHLKHISDAFCKEPLRSRDTLDDVRLDYSGLIKYLKELKDEVVQLKAEDEKLKAEGEKLKAEGEKQKKLIQELQQETHVHKLRMVDFVKAAVSPAPVHRLPSSPGCISPRKRPRSASTGSYKQ